MCNGTRRAARGGGGSEGSLTHHTPLPAGATPWGAQRTVPLGSCPARLPPARRPSLDARLPVVLRNGTPAPGGLWGLSYRASRFCLLRVVVRVRFPFLLRLLVSGHVAGRHSWGIRPFVLS